MIPTGPCCTSSSVGQFCSNTVQFTCIVQIHNKCWITCVASTLQQAVLTFMQPAVNYCIRAKAISLGPSVSLKFKTTYLSDDHSPHLSFSWISFSTSLFQWKLWVVQMWKFNKANVLLNLLLIFSCGAVLVCFKRN